MAEVMNISEDTPHRYKVGATTYYWGPGEVRDVPPAVARVVTTAHPGKMVAVTASGTTYLRVDGSPLKAAPSEAEETIPAEPEAVEETVVVEPQEEAEPEVPLPFEDRQVTPAPTAQRTQRGRRQPRPRKE